MLPVIALFFTACSADNDEMDTNTADSAVLMNNVQVAQDSDKPYYPDCFDSVSGTVAVDLSNGFTNPIVDFTAHAVGGYGSAKKSYTVTIQFQTLTDCEDINSDSGNIISYSLASQVRNPQLNPPTIAIVPSQLPEDCYKWRFVLESGIIGSSILPYCQTASPWYEAPIF